MNTEGERTQGQHRSEELPDMEAHALQSLNVGRESIAEHLREQQRAEEAEADLDREKILVRLADGACCGCGFTSVCTEPVIHEPSKVESLRKKYFIQCCFLGMCTVPLHDLVVVVVSGLPRLRNSGAKSEPVAQQRQSHIHRHSSGEPRLFGKGENVRIMGKRETPGSQYIICLCITITGYETKRIKPPMLKMDSAQ